jgi:hypothetical protein
MITSNSKNKFNVTCRRTAIKYIPFVYLTAFVEIQKENKKFMHQTKLQDYIEFHLISTIF